MGTGPVAAAHMNTPWTVDVLHLVEGEDDYGNDVTDHDEDNPDTQAVYGWGPAGTSEEGGWRTQVEADLHLYAPPGFRCGPSDLVRLPDGRTFHVEGELEDFNHGPFGFRPGVRVNLRRTTG